MNSYIGADYISSHFPEIDTSRFTATTISGMIAEASARVNELCNVDGFEHQTVTNELLTANITNRGDLVIWPRVTPIESVSAITIRKGDFTMALTLTNNGASVLEIPYPKRRVIYPANSLETSGVFTVRDLVDLRQSDVLVQISYVAGSQTIPRSIQRATGLLVKDMLAGQNNPLGASQITQGRVSIKYSETGSKSDAALDAESLLAEYVRNEL